MANVLIRHKVRDYDAWEAIFKRDSDFLEKAGCSAFRLYRTEENPEDLVIFFSWDEANKAIAYFQSDHLKKTMLQAGVIGNPEPLFLEKLESRHFGKTNSETLRLFCDLFNSKNIEQAIMLTAPTVHWFDTAFQTNFKGRDGMRKYLENWHRAFPDAKIEITRIFEFENEATVEFKKSGTHTGSFEGSTGMIYPTNRAINIQFCKVVNFEGGLIVSGRTYFDATTMFEQLGLTLQTKAA